MGNQENWGIKFSEHMGGFFCEGITDPSEGFSRGKDGAHKIDFWVTVKTEKLAEFMRNPDMTATITGKVSTSPLGKDLPIRNGEFNMFPGEEGSGLRHITYRFGFTSIDSEPCYFSGIKNIHIDPKQRERSDVATLYSRLYKGESEDGELIGSGILRFNPLKDTLSLLLSLRVFGTRSFAFGEKLQALRMFGAEM